MTQEEKLELLEEILEADEGTLKVEDIDVTMNLEEMDEWDSLSKLGLMAEVKTRLNKRLTVEEVQKFKTVQDIIDYL
mgnify:CR=1 FL=1